MRAAARAGATWRRGPPAPALRARQGAGGRGRLRGVLRPLRQGQRAAPRPARLRRRRDQPRRCARAKALFTPGVLRRARRRRAAPAPRPDLHRRPAALRLDPDRADPRQPLGRSKAPWSCPTSSAIAARPRRRARRGRRSRLSGGAGRPATPDELARAGRGISRAHAHPAQARPAVLHRQDAEQFPACRPDPADPAEREDHRRAPPPDGLLLLGFKQHFARGQVHLRPDRARPLLRATMSALMAHFDAVLPGAVHRVIYEDMVDDTEGEVRRLLDYCGLPFEEACLRFHENDRAVRTASSEQVRQPIFRDGLDQWRQLSSRWLGPLKAALGGRSGSDRRVLTDVIPGRRVDAATRFNMTNRRGEASDERTNSMRGAGMRRARPRASAGLEPADATRCPRPAAADATATGGRPGHRGGRRHRREARGEPADGADQRPGARQPEAGPAQHHRLRRLREVHAQRDLPDARAERQTSQHLHARRLQRRQRQPLRPAAQRRHLSRRAADHHDRRHPGHPRLRHRPGRGAGRPAGHALRRQLRGRARIRIITNKPDPTHFAAAYDLQGNDWRPRRRRLCRRGLRQHAARRQRRRAPGRLGRARCRLSSTTSPARAPSPTSGVTIDNAAVAKHDYNTGRHDRRPRGAGDRPRRQLDDRRRPSSASPAQQRRLRLRAQRRRPPGPALRPGHRRTTAGCRRR